MHKIYVLLQSLLLATLLLVAINTTAQTDTVYLNEHNEKCTADEAKYYRLFHKIAEGYYQRNDYYVSTGKLQQIGYCYSTDTPKLQGHCINYNKYGKMESQGYYKDGILHGYWAYYYPDTTTSTYTIWYTTTYDEGKQIDKLESYYPSGKLKRVQTYKKKNGKPTGKCYDETGKKIPFTAFEIMPVAGYSIPKYLKKTMTYPTNSRNKNIEGRIIIKFTIDSTGAIKDARVAKSLSPETDAEALKAIANMPPWQPGIQDDKKVAVSFTLPIVYKLE